MNLIRAREITRDKWPMEPMTHYAKAVAADIDKKFDLEGLRELCKEYSTDVDNIVNVIIAERLCMELENVEEELAREAAQ